MALYLCKHVTVEGTRKVNGYQGDRQQNEDQKGANEQRKHPPQCLLPENNYSRVIVRSNGILQYLTRAINCYLNHY